MVVQTGVLQLACWSFQCRTAAVLATNIRGCPTISTTADLWLRDVEHLSSTKHPNSFVVQTCFQWQLLVLKLRGSTHCAEAAVQKFFQLQRFELTQFATLWPNAVWRSSFVHTLCLFVFCCRFLALQKRETTEAISFSRMIKHFLSTYWMPQHRCEDGDDHHTNDAFFGRHLSA